MALVNYSDSESDSEAPQPPPAPVPKSAKPAFQKSQPGKIVVDLPTLKPEPGQVDADSADGPPTKRPRTGGAFSGFNSLLPAPKRKLPPKRAVNLKTSGEASFSRAPPLSDAAEDGGNATGLPGDVAGRQEDTSETASEPPPELKLTGKTTRFLPLSVSHKLRKKKPVSKAVVESTATPDAPPVVKATAHSVPATAGEDAAKPKPKRSLFGSQPTEATSEPSSASIRAYEPMISTSDRTDTTTSESIQAPPIAPTTNPNSLEFIAADLNLTPSQRRQLLGRNSKSTDPASVAHFDLDSEYASNEVLRRSGETFEHRAVKAIAPGKHSLQQLVNNASTQKDGLEDAWAQGKRNRGEGASKYGWGKG